jgi:hypothetical protein
MIGALHLTPDNLALEVAKSLSPDSSGKDIVSFDEYLRTREC